MDMISKYDLRESVEDSKIMSFEEQEIPIKIQLRIYWRTLIHM